MAESQNMFPFLGNIYPSETVLVVEDNKGTADVAARAIRKELRSIDLVIPVYDIVSGRQVIVERKKQGLTVDLVVLDGALPLIEGAKIGVLYTERFAEELQHRWPEIIRLGWSLELTEVMKTLCHDTIKFDKNDLQGLARYVVAMLKKRRGSQNPGGIIFPSPSPSLLN
jgi:CheY-like chemotaxis protein